MSFLPAPHDQIVHDAAIQNLPVRFALDRAGLVGGDGWTRGAGALDDGGGRPFREAPDEDLVLRLAREHEVLITVEEGSIGGFGSFVLHCLADHGMLDQGAHKKGLKVRAMVMPDMFIDHDKPERMYAQAGLDAGAIVAKVFAALGREMQDEKPQRPRVIA